MTSINNLFKAIGKRMASSVAGGGDESTGPPKTDDVIHVAMEEMVRKPCQYTW